MVECGVRAGRQRWHGVELLFFVILCGLAAGLRFWNLGEIPAGLHGDEAWTGLDARRVLSEGWIGPYAGSALGQPLGPVYAVAGLFLWLPDDVATIRAAMAIFGVLGIAFTYLATREYEGPVAAGFAALLLTGSVWHLHASRVGMMFVSCSTLLMAGLWLQAVAVRRGAAGWFALAGFVAGLGIYTYNAYPSAAPLYAVPFVYAWLRSPSAGERRAVRRGVGAFGLAALAAAAPMIEWIARSPDQYFSHHRMVSLFARPEWQSATWWERTEMVGRRASVWFSGVVWQARFDASDGYGAAGVPMIDLVMGVLVAFGVVIAIARWRRPLSGVILIAIPLIGCGAVLTTGFGGFRRTIALAPMVAILAALPLAALYRWPAVADAGWRRASRAAAMAVAIVLAATSVILGARSYFERMIHHRRVDTTYCRDLYEAVEYLGTLPRETRTYLFSGRWSCSYETIRYLAPDLDCIDGSQHFGAGRGRGSSRDFDGHRGEPSVFVLMGSETARRNIVKKRHPKAREYLGRVGKRLAFAAYHLPDGPSPTPRREYMPFAIVPSQRFLSLTEIEPDDLDYGFAVPRVDRAWYGAPLELGGRRVAKGFGMHAPTVVTYRVPQRAVVVRAMVGVPTPVGDCDRGTVVFEIRDGGGRVLASSGVVRASDAPKLLRTRVAGIDRIQLVVGDAGDGRDCDHANWANPTFVLKMPR